MLPWIISATLYSLGGLNMAVFVSDHVNFKSGRCALLVGLWPFAAILAIVEASTGIEFW